MSLKATSSQLPKKEPAKYALFFEDDLTEELWHHREEIKDVLSDFWRIKEIQFFIHPGKSTVAISPWAFFAENVRSTSTEGILFIHQKINNFKLTYHIATGYTSSEIERRNSLYSALLYDWIPNLLLINERDGWNLPITDSVNKFLITTGINLRDNAMAYVTNKDRSASSARDLFMKLDLDDVKVPPEAWYNSGYLTVAHELFHIYQWLQDTIWDYEETSGIQGGLTDTSEDHVWFFEASAELFSGNGVIRLFRELLPDTYEFNQEGQWVQKMDYSYAEISWHIDTYIDDWYSNYVETIGDGYTFGYLALAFLHKKLIGLGSSFQELFRILIETGNLDESLDTIFEKDMTSSEDEFSFSEFLEVFYSAEGRAFCKEFLKWHSSHLSTQTFDAGTVKSTYFGESGLKFNELLPTDVDASDENIELLYGTRNLQQSLGRIEGWIKKQPVERKPNCLIYICGVSRNLLTNDEVINYGKALRNLKTESTFFKKIDVIKSVYWINIVPSMLDDAESQMLAFVSIENNINYIEIPPTKLEATLNLIPSFVDSKETRSKVGYNNLKITQTVKANLR
jgi:hypothetical protein